MDHKREFLRELRDPPERVIDAIMGMDAREQTSGDALIVERSRADAITKWQNAIDALLYR